MKNKLEEKELKQLQEIIGEVNNQKAFISRVEIEKHQAFKILDELDSQMKEFQLVLRNKYGDVVVDVKDGTLSDRRDEDNKKD